MVLTASQKIDTLTQSAQIVGIGIDELFLSEKDYNEIKQEAAKNTLIEDAHDTDLLCYQSTIGLIKLSKK